MPDDASFESAAAELLPVGESRAWNNAIVELGGLACEEIPVCNEADCPWRERCYACETGDFTAPDVSTQPAFEGSRRQFRSRILRTLGEYDELTPDEFGPQGMSTATRRRERDGEVVVQLR